MNKPLSHVASIYHLIDEIPFGTLECESMKLSAKLMETMKRMKTLDPNSLEMAIAETDLVNDGFAMLRIDMLLDLKRAYTEHKAQLALIQADKILLDTKFT